MKKHYFLLGLACLCMTMLTAQSEISGFHDETPDDPYVWVDKTLMPRNPAYNQRNPNFYTTQVNVDANGDNIIGDAGNEPSIAIDPTNPDRIVIGWRQFDTTSNNFRQAGNGYSNDGGLTFINPGVLDPGVFRSDPVLDFDSDGNFYYNSLKGTFECDVYKITDGGNDWGSPVPAFGGDKQWMYIDKSGGPSAGHNYSNWNASFTTCAPGAFTRSTDGSDSFENCVQITNDPFWGTLTVDSNSDLFMVGRTGANVVVVKSTNAKDPGQTVSWDSSTVIDLDGIMTTSGPINPQGLRGQAWIDSDRTGGPNDGTLYVLSTVDRFSNADPADVMFTKSTDGGNNWTAPTRVNIEPGTSSYQWFGTMSVAPNGRIDVVYLDTSQAGAGSVDSRLIYCWSDDQGDTWNDYLVISDLFDPTIGYPNQNKMGDYFDMKSDNDFAHLAWCNTLNGGQDVYYSRISPDGILSVDDIAAAEGYGFVSYPNPVVDSTTLQFYTGDDQQATLNIYDLQGKLINNLFDGPTSGTQKIEWDATSANGSRVAKGLYFSVLTIDGQSYLQKLVVQ